MSAITAAAPATKHPQDDVTMVFPFGAWLCSGDAVESVAGVTEPTGGIAIMMPAVANATQITANISGGVAGENYTITAGVVTRGGDTLHRVFLLKVRDD